MVETDTKSFWDTSATWRRAHTGVHPRDRVRVGLAGVEVPHAAAPQHVHRTAVVGPRQMTHRKAQAGGGGVTRLAGPDGEGGVGPGGVLEAALSGELLLLLLWLPAQLLWRELGYDCGTI